MVRLTNSQKCLVDELGPETMLLMKQLKQTVDPRSVAAESGESEGTSGREADTAIMQMAHEPG